jgi:hypothetical protein
LASAERLAAESARIEAGSSNFTAFAARDAAIIARNEAEAFSIITEEVRVEVSDEISAAVATEALARANADSALSAQVTSLTAAVGANEAAISAESVARANADSALSAQVTSLTARTDDNEADIATEALARTNADSALSSTIESVRAASGATLCVPDNTFLTYGAAGGWLAYEGGAAASGYPGGQTLTSTVATGGLAGVAHISNRTGWSGAKRPQSVSLEVALTRITGDLGGAGLLVYFRSGATIISTQTFRLAQLQATPLGVRSVITAVARNTSSTQADRVDVYLMAGWPGFSETIAAKQIQWHSCDIRPASAEEIGGGRVGDAIAAAIEVETTARVAGDSALSAQITSLSASVGAQFATVNSTLATKVDSAGALAAVNNQVSAQGRAGLATVSDLTVATSRADGAVQATTVLTVESNGIVARRTMTASPQGGLITFEAARFAIWNSATLAGDAPFEVVGGQVRIRDAAIGTARIGTLLLAGEAVTPEKLRPNAVSRPYAATISTNNAIFATVQMDRAGYILAGVVREVNATNPSSASSVRAVLYIDGIQVAQTRIAEIVVGTAGESAGQVIRNTFPLDASIFAVQAVAAGSRQVRVELIGAGFTASTGTGFAVGYYA